MAANRIFELRTYHAGPGKFDALIDRFRHHTIALFAKHDIDVVGFWIPVDQADTLVYVLAYPDAAQAKVNWAAFQGDPEWIKAKSASEVNGPLTDRIESVFLNPTEFSAIK